MMFSVIGLLTILACLMTIASAIGRAPLWVAVLLLSLVDLLRLAPLGG